jgi:hypothetical protein
MSRKKKGGTEAYLGTFHETLKEYESAIMLRAKAVSALANCDQNLEELRKQLLHLAGGKPPVADRLPTAPKAAKAEKRAAPTKSIEAKLEDVDPRIKRSMETTQKALKALGGSAHKTAVAKKLGISTQAVIQRLSRGVKMGVLHSAGKGIYGLRSS